MIKMSDDESSGYVFCKMITFIDCRLHKDRQVLVELIHPNKMEIGENKEVFITKLLPCYNVSTLQNKNFLYFFQRNYHQNPKDEKRVNSTLELMKLDLNEIFDTKRKLSEIIRKVECKAIECKTIEENLEYYQNIMFSKLVNPRKEENTNLEGSSQKHQETCMEEDEFLKSQFIVLQKYRLT